MQAIRRGSGSIKDRPRYHFAAQLIRPRAIRQTVALSTISPCHASTTSRSAQNPPIWRIDSIAHPAASRYASSATYAAQQGQALEVEDQASQGGPITRFKELGERGLVCQTVVDTLTRDMGMETLTDVQSLTINQSLKGVDTVAQARTGTGKTLAFLIPIVQNIVKHDPSLEKPPGQGRRGAEYASGIRALIISPTRELAEQIAVEARKVTQNTRILTQTAVGGSSKREGLRRIQRGCNILVGTPGRLKDILSDARSGIETPKLSILVLDEADRLLEQGFEEDIREIQRLLPDKRDVDRQTLLFSATVPKEIMPVIRATMKRDFKFVQTVKAGEQQTHEKVPQKVVNVGRLENQMPAFVELVLRELQKATPERPFKAVVFLPTLNEVVLAAQTMRHFRTSRRTEASSSGIGLPRSTEVAELHSKLSQQQRNIATAFFRHAKSAILLASDVAARGMDFPDVTHVIQVGLPPSEEQYVHRIGRTARAGKTGEAWLLVSKMEMRDVRYRLGNMPLKPDTTLRTPNVDMSDEATIPQDLADMYRKLTEATDAVPTDVKSAAYVGTFGLYQSHSNKRVLVEAVNARALYALGFQEPPPIPHGRALKFGLLGVPGIQIGQEREPRRRSGFVDRDHGRGDRASRGRYGSERGERGRSAYGRGDRAPRGNHGYGRGDRENGPSPGFGGRNQEIRERPSHGRYERTKSSYGSDSRARKPRILRS